MPTAKRRIATSAARSRASAARRPAPIGTAAQRCSAPSSISPTAFALQGYVYNRVMFNALISRLGQAIVGEMTMDCRQLKFGVSPGTPADLRSIPGMPTPWEMIADGGVVVRTNTEKRGLIEGTAARVSYESKKSWLNVQGTQGQSAFVRQTWPDGRKGFQTHSPRMLLNLKTFEFQTVMQDAQFNNVTLPK